MNKLQKKPANEMIPGDLFVPGEYIKDEMEARGMKQVELAAELGISKSEMSLLISGKRNISILIAIQLEKVFAIEAETWMNIQVKYDILNVKIGLAKELELISVPAMKKKELKKTIIAG